MPDESEPKYTDINQVPKNVYEENAFGRIPAQTKDSSPMNRFWTKFASVWDGPVTWFRGKF